MINYKKTELKRCACFKLPAVLSTAFITSDNFIAGQGWRIDIGRYISHISNTNLSESVVAPIPMIRCVKLGL